MVHKIFWLNSLWMFISKLSLESLTIIQISFEGAVLTYLSRRFTVRYCDQSLSVRL